MPINYFVDRPEESKKPDCLHQGDIVMIIPKDKQGTTDPKDLVLGKINRILSKGLYYENGAKVEVLLHPKDWRFEKEGYISYIGRVQYIVKYADS
jgi:hypothetical protein